MKKNSFLADRVTNLRLAWIKYWTLQRKSSWDWSSMSFRRALAIFLTLILGIYFIIGLPVFSYLIYGKKSEGLPLALASTLYPFPVATVGGDVILLKPYYDRLTYLKFFAERTDQTVPEGVELRNQVIDKLIDEAVMRNWAQKEGIVVTNEDIDSAYEKIIKDRGSESDVKTVLSQLYNLNESEFKRLIPDLLYREKIERILLERVHVKHILLSTEALATKVRGELDLPNFDDKAKQYSEDKTTRDNGGDLGFFDHEQAKKLDPELEKVFFSLEPGQISGPVKTPYGYHLIYVLEKSGKEAMSFTGWLEAKRKETKIHRFLK